MGKAKGQVVKNMKVNKVRKGWLSHTIMKNTDFLKFEKTLKEIKCKHLSLQGNDARSFEPLYGPYKGKVWSVILISPIVFFFDRSGKYLGNDSEDEGGALCRK